MVTVCAPIVHPGADALFPQYLVQRTYIGQKLILPGALAHTDDGTLVER